MPIRSTLAGVRARIGVLLLLASMMVAPALAAEPGGTMLEQPPQYGIYYDRYEPSFYTGFAPRTLDPRRMHVHIGRGNQMRVTVVLGDDVLREYARDLQARRQTVRALSAGGKLVLTQNRAFDQFSRTLDEVELERLVREESTLSPEALAARNLQLFERLNPGRVFRIRMPVDEVVRRWAAQVRPADHVRMDNRRRLELINLMLPTRLWIAELDSKTAAELDALVRACPPAPADAAAVEALRPAFLALLERVSGGIYPVRDGALQFTEFTAIYPVGTFNQYTTIAGGRQIPEYPTPGRRALTTHQRTQTIDHVPTDMTYSYFPWLPYMHVGTRLHNAVHTLFWRMKPAETSFLPPAWREVPGENGKPAEYLWLLSRGPMSHGCTHLNAGHISELRQLLPVDTDQLDDVDVFYNTSPLYDVFDIDGDFAPEVMGVRYYIAYSLKNDRPDRLRVRNERRAYYEWLYAGELDYDAEERGVFASVRDGHFVARSAVPGAEHAQIKLYEAEYEPERIQFYKPVDIPFARELRKVGARHPFSTPVGAAAGAR